MDALPILTPNAPVCTIAFLLACCILVALTIVLPTALAWRVARLAAVMVVSFSAPDACATSAVSLWDRTELLWCDESWWIAWADSRPGMALRGMVVERDIVIRAAEDAEVVGAVAGAVELRMSWGVCGAGGGAGFAGVVVYLASWGFVVVVIVAAGAGGAGFTASSLGH